MMNNPILNPSKKIVIFLLIAWCIGVLLLVLASTNLFTESMFQRKYTITNGLIFSATITALVVTKNYLKSKK
ncbi:hypothetical protein K8354_06850 [Polaribacter litorisediminis]|uniref:hypothetical protein n=1 Tax=Polaribacter litorisediminis TaxID=1908341 RepID=UPI001CBF6BC7|nr:hypothetical protein [Polaribacter litorisediminis]UAM99521.1 hypothetical protein K8354_06850 [Polaribacter litorisediminis]